MPKGCSGTMARTLDDSDAPNTVCEPQSIALLSRTFSRNLLAVDLAEPLSSLDDHQAPTLAFASRSGRDRLSPSEFPRFDHVITKITPHKHEQKS